MAEGEAGGIEDAQDEGFRGDRASVDPRRALEATAKRPQEELSTLQTERNSECQDFELQELERQAETKRALYQEFLSRYRVTQERVEGIAADASVITQAIPRREATAISLAVFAVFGSVDSLALGCVLAFLQGRSDRTDGDDGPDAEQPFEALYERSLASDCRPRPSN